MNFIIIQAAPGGPVEKAIAQIKGNEVSVTQRFTSSGGEQSQTNQNNQLNLNFKDLNIEVPKELIQTLSKN